MKKTNNKGFSLVELIVVIAIMAVLIGVLAPTFTKYIEQSRRSTDIQNAEQIKAAIIADMADESITTYDTPTTKATLTASNKPSTVTEIPKIQSSLDKGGDFQISYDRVQGTCSVYAAGYELTLPADAKTYKDNKTVTAKK